MFRSFIRSKLQYSAESTNPFSRRWRTSDSVIDNELILENKMISETNKSSNPSMFTMNTHKD